MRDTNHLTKEEAEKAKIKLLSELTDDYSRKYAEGIFLDFPRCDFCGQSVPTDSQYREEGCKHFVCSLECFNELEPTPSVSRFSRDYEE